MITVQAQNKIRASRTVTHWTARLHKTSRAPQVCQKKKKNPTPEQKKKSRRQHLCFTTLYKQQPIINVTPKGVVRFGPAMFSTMLSIRSTTTVNVQCTVQNCTVIALDGCEN